MAKTVQDPDKLLRLQTEMPELAALTRNTCSITILQGSAKINVIPPEASAQLDCRLLPDQDVAAFKRGAARRAQRSGHHDRTAARFHAGRVVHRQPAVPHDRGGHAARTIPSAAIVPAVSTGFTDSHFFRDRGIASYGYAPFLIPEADEAGVHGNNERISLANIRTGTQMMYEIVMRMVTH